MATRAEIQDLVDKLVAGYDPEKVILFGSHAYGTPNADSDIDLFVIKDDPRPRHQRQMDASQAMGRRKIPVDVLVYTPAEYAVYCTMPFSSLIQDVVNRGKIVYDKRA